MGIPQRLSAYPLEVVPYHVFTQRSKVVLVPHGDARSGHEVSPTAGHVPLYQVAGVLLSMIDISTCGPRAASFQS